MAIDLSTYDLVIFDGFGTLYDKDMVPLSGAEKLLKAVSRESMLFSNVGSMRGDQLRSRLDAGFDNLPSTIITSMDLLIRHLKRLDEKSIYHFGGNIAAHELENQGIRLASPNHQPELIVFTSLPGNNWIQESQTVLRMINNQTIKRLILANPDRLLPGDHVGINIGMFFDMLVKNWPKSFHKIPILEIGKPSLSRSELNIEVQKKLLVVGE